MLKERGPVSVGEYDASEAKPKTFGEALLTFARNIARKVKQEQERERTPKLLTHNKVLNQEPNQEIALNQTTKEFGKLRKSLPPEQLNDVSLESWFRRIPTTEETENNLAQKFQEAADENKQEPARRVLQDPNRIPQDERVSQAVEQLFDEPKDGETVDMQAQRVAEDLATIAVSTANTPEIAREVQQYLQRIQQEYALNNQQMDELIAIAQPQGIMQGLDINQIPETFTIDGQRINIRQRIQRRIGMLENAGIPRNAHLTDEDLVKGVLEDVQNIRVNSREFGTLEPETQDQILILERRLNQRNQLFKQSEADRVAQAREYQRLPRHEYPREDGERKPDYYVPNDFRLENEQLDAFYGGTTREGRDLLARVRMQFEDASPDTAEGLNRTLEQYTKYLVSLKDPQLEDGLKTFMVRNGIPEHEFEARKAKLFEDKDKFMRMLDVRRKMMYAAYTIEKTGDTEKAKGQMANLGVSGFHEFLNQDGGVIEIVYNKYAEILNEARRNDHDVLRPFTTTEFRDARTKLRKEIRSELSILNERYFAEYGEEITSDDQIEYLMLSAQDALVAVHRYDLMVLRGRTPDVRIDSDRPTYGQLDSLDLSFKLRRYGMLSPAEDAVWRENCRAAAYAFQIDKSVREWLREEDIRAGSPEAIELLQSYFGEEKPEEHKGHDEHHVDYGVAEMKKFLHVNPGGTKRDESTIPIHYKDVSQEDLVYILTTKQGEALYSRWITGGVADYFSSGWRMSSYINLLDKIYGSEAIGLAQGVRFKLAWDDYIGAENHHDRSDFLKKLRAQTEKLAAYKPHSVLDMMIDIRPSQAKILFASLQQSGDINGIKGLESTSITRPGELVSALRRRHQLVLELLAREGRGGLNYLEGNFDATQRRIIEKACVLLGDDSAESYLSTMKKIAQWGNQERTVHKIANITSAARIGLMTLSADDLRLKELGDEKLIQRAIHGEDPDVDFVSIAKMMIDKGKAGPHDPLAREWGDFDMAKPLQDIAYQLLGKDNKELVELLGKLKPLISGISGQKVLSRAALISMAGHAKIASTFKAHDWLFMGEQPDSSALRQWLGSDAESLGLTERHMLFDEVKKVIRGLDLAPETVEWIENYIGLKNAIPLGDGNYRFTGLPLNLYRGRLFMLIVLGIVLAGAATSSVAGFSGSMADGGGGASSGGGGHH